MVQDKLKGSETVKKKQNAREKRAEMRPNWKPEKKQAVRTKPPAPQLTPEEQERIEAEETKLFLDHIEKYSGFKDEEVVSVRKKSMSATIREINLEDGMPVVDEAIHRMSIGIQEMRISGIKIVKLIHGYGSTGKGGRIRIGVQTELETMKKRRLIRDYIPGERFGPFDESSRRMAERDRSITKDPDYGRDNHGVTIVVIT